MDRHLVEIVPNFIYWDWNKTAKGFVVYFELPDGRVHHRLVCTEAQTLVYISEEDGFIVLTVE